MKDRSGIYSDEIEAILEAMFRDVKPGVGNHIALAEAKPVGEGLQARLDVTVFGNAAVMSMIEALGQSPSVAEMAMIAMAFDLSTEIHQRVNTFVLKLAQAEMGLIMDEADVSKRRPASALAIKSFARSFISKVLDIEIARLRRLAGDDGDHSDVYDLWTRVGRETAKRVDVVFQQKSAGKNDFAQAGATKVAEGVAFVGMDASEAEQAASRAMAFGAFKKKPEDLS